jgi:hypothetical protein
MMNLQSPQPSSDVSSRLVHADRAAADFPHSRLFDITPPPRRRPSLVLRRGPLHLFRDNFVGIEGNDDLVCVCHDGSRVTAAWCPTVSYVTPYQRNGLSQRTLDLKGGGDGKSGQEREYGKRELHGCDGLFVL